MAESPPVAPEPAPTPETPLAASSVTIDTIDPNGYRVTWHLAADTPGASMRSLITSLTTLTKWLTEHKWEPYFDEVAPAAAAGLAAAAPDTSRPAYWIGEFTDPVRRCSLHGPAELKPAGVSKRTRKPYGAFWACTNKECTPEGVNG